MNTFLRDIFGIPKYPKYRPHEGVRAGHKLTYVNVFPLL